MHSAALEGVAQPHNRPQGWLRREIRDLIDKGPRKSQSGDSGSHQPPVQSFGGSQEDVTTDDKRIAKELRQLKAPDVAGAICAMSTFQGRSFASKICTVDVPSAWYGIRC